MLSENLQKLECERSLAMNITAIAVLRSRSRVVLKKINDYDSRSTGCFFACTSKECRGDTANNPLHAMTTDPSSQKFRSQNVRAMLSA